MTTTPVKDGCEWRPGEGRRLTRERVKESAMGSYAGVKAIASCYHDWRPRPAVLFGYLEVDAQCSKCKTWWRPPEDLK